MPDTVPPSGYEVVPDGVAFRLAKVKDQFPANSRKPLPVHFEFSSEEREEGQRTGLWFLSVWDQRRKSPTQARAFLTTAGERIAFALPVIGVLSIKLPSNPKTATPGDAHPLWILRDIRPSIVGPGADGHCAIFGIQRASSDERKALRNKLCDIADPL